MKKKHLSFLMLILLAASCSVNKKTASHWITYLEPNAEANFFEANKDPFISRNTFFRNFTNNIKPKEDSVLITTKNGKNYRGFISKSDFDGYFIKISNNREIYISNLEIKTIQFLESTMDTKVTLLNRDTFFENSSFRPSNRSISPTITTNSPSDVWDNANAEFEQPRNSNTKIVSKQTNQKKTQEPLSVISFISLVLSPFTAGVGLPLALILSKISLKKIKKNPEKYIGRGLARFTFIVSTIIVTVSLLLVIFVIALFI